MKSGEGYPNRIASFGLKRLIRKFEHPTRLVQITLDFVNFLWVFGRLVDTSEEYIKVIIVHPTVHFSFFCVCKYLHIASYLYGKQIKSNLGTKLYL